MTVTQSTDIFVPDILTETVRGKLRGKNALVGSVFVSSGAITVSGTMPASGRAAIGKTIDFPYFGRLGRFETLTESQSPTPKKIAESYESATVGRSSIAFEVSRWARGASAIRGDRDPYDESADQVVEEVQREIDRLMVTEGATSPLLASHYSATVPVYMNYSQMVTDKAVKLGDEQSDGIVAMACHSLVLADMANEKDSTGRPLLTLPADGSVIRIAGIPVVQTDRVPLTGSTMGTVTSTGTNPPGITLTGTPTGPWQLYIDIVGAGTVGNATFRFSTDGGNTWSATLTTAASVELTDTAVDSLVGNNGETGITCAFTAGTHAADNVYVSTANLCVESQIWMRDAGGFWYNEAAMSLQTDTDILEDTDIAAMHLYGVPHIYRRRRGGSRPGVLRIRTNVRGFVG